MRNDSLRPGFGHRNPTDGWLGTLELPGYRAGNVVAKLDDLPEVDPHHLYFDLLLLDAGGHTQDNHSGPCPALPRAQSLDERSRFVRVVAELVRHVPGDMRGLAALGRALTFIRERGIGDAGLIAAAQMIDDVCSEQAVTHSLHHLLELALGDDEARRVMCDVAAELARNTGFGALDFSDSGLADQVSYVVRTVGKTRARHYLRSATDFEMVPKPDMFGV
jgi:hypothetical protein